MLVVAAAANPTVVSVAYLIGAAVLLLRPTALRSPRALAAAATASSRLSSGRTRRERLQRLRGTYAWLAAAAAAILVTQYAVLLASQPPLTPPPSSDGCVPIAGPEDRPGNNTPALPLTPPRL
jgi:hypothetical protein